MEDAGKRVSWVELYVDLVFVLAVGQLAHLIVEHPVKRSVWIALGLFFTLWWTWVGFAVLYNRHGVEDDPRQRLLFLAGSVPAAVAAVAIAPAAEGDAGVFAAAMAVTRVILAAANGAVSEDDLLQQRIFRAYVFSAVLFAVSIVVPEPFRYALWAIAIVTESNAMLNEDREGARRARRDHDLSALRPADPGEALDPHHFAERFGLFLIILLGEVLVEAGTASAPADLGTGGWAALVAAMVLAGGLWWLYFDSAAEFNLKVLELSGGSPTMARAIFAVGHMLPAFALLITAAGVGLLLEEDPPRAAYWLACVGIGIYVAGTRSFLRGTPHVPGAVRALVLVATFFLGRLAPSLSPHAYLWVLTAWVGICAALTIRSAGDGNGEPDARGSRRRSSTTLAVDDP
jgi:low temperature requirement protein LtrA